MKKIFKIKEMPKIERPREKLISKGAQNLKKFGLKEPIFCSRMKKVMANKFYKEKEEKKFYN